MWFQRKTAKVREEQAGNENSHFKADEKARPDRKRGEGGKFVKASDGAAQA